MQTENEVTDAGEFTNHDPRTTPAESLERYAHWRGGACPVAHSSAFGGFFVLSRYADVRASAKDWKRFSSAQGVLRPPLPERARLIESDPPQHTADHELVKEVLNPKAYRAFDVHLREDVSRLIDGFLPLGDVDLVAALCEPLPVLTICAMVGLDPDETARVRPLAMEMFEAHKDPELAALTEIRFNAMVQGFSDARRAHPRDDFVTRLATKPHQGEMLEDDEIGNLLQGFLIAGHHTTTSAMASLFRNILGRPGVKQQLIEDPELVRAAVEETLRIDTPLHMFGRTTTCPVTINDAEIPEGSFVMLNWAAANHDPARFEQPTEFRLDRSPNPHLAFGYGIHSCTGAQLARNELLIAAEEVLRRMPDIELAAEAPGHRFSGGNLAVLPELRVRFTPR